MWETLAAINLPWLGRVYAIKVVILEMGTMALGLPHDRILTIFLTALLGTFARYLSENTILNLMVDHHFPQSNSHLAIWRIPCFQTNPDRPPSSVGL